jgi:hypothetical protein
MLWQGYDATVMNNIFGTTYFNGGGGFGAGQKQIMLNDGTRGNPIVTGEIWMNDIDGDGVNDVRVGKSPFNLNNGSSSMADLVANGTLMWGTDYDTNDYIRLKAGYEDDLIPLSYYGTGTGTQRNYTMIMSRKRNIIWCGDAGFIGSNNGVWASAANSMPFTIDANDKPIPNTAYTIGTIYNSFLFANMMYWAIYQAQHYGINSGGLPAQGW